MSEINITGNITLKSRTNLALHHLLAACRLLPRINDIERENANQPFGAFWEEILHNCLGVATLAVASIESYANESYFEGSILIPELNSVAARELANIVDTESILQKYSLALALRTGSSLDLGSATVQNADALIKLRNAVVHFHPEWFEEQTRHAKLSKILQGKFRPSVFLPNEPIFPRAWASYGFATWSIQTTVEFLEHFYSTAGVPSPLEKFKPRISTMSGITIP